MPCPAPLLGAILKEGALNVPESLSTAIQIAGAVETAHRAGIVHRDIKPANILFTTYRRPVLSDFGISAMSGPEGSEELRGMSVPWAPPEQLVGMRSANPASDVYSLGATTFAMLTGRSPSDHHFLHPAEDRLRLIILRQILQRTFDRTDHRDARSAGSAQMLA